MTDLTNIAEEPELVDMDSSKDASTTDTSKLKKKSKKKKKSKLKENSVEDDVEQPPAQEDAMDGLLEKKTESELSASLTPTIYSIIYVCSAKGKAFYMALLMFCFQISFPIVVLLDLIDSAATGSNNVLSIPAGISIEVRVAGFLSLVLAVPYFSDTLHAIEKLQEGYDPIVTKQSPHATRM